MSVAVNICTLLFLLLLLSIFLPEVHAFGAGDIPDFAYMNDRAFRHGDIENILSNIAKSASRAGGGSGLLGLAVSVVKSATGGSKFSKADIKKVYFGNWLRDYSQCMDIAGLQKLSADTLVLIVRVLGFMEFGFATEEFEVTTDRLGVYLPVEHIDNPKGYAEKEGDARQFHRKLRPPVDPRELEVDERTGMKNYMATENRGWDTSTAHIRRMFLACIEYGRRAGGRDGADLWEAYRLMGTGLHTMEDLLAHSNWCEITLRKMGHREVFCHVGESTDINTPNGRAPPLVTGTFGGADFLHSLMGEATDKISSSSVTSLADKMNEASSDQGMANNVSKLKTILGKLPIGGSDDKLQQGEQLQAQAKAYRFDPDNFAPPEVQNRLMDLLVWRDRIYREVMEKIEMVPGLTDMIDELTNALNAYVYTILAPYITPILKESTSILSEGSQAVIDTEDQYEVFDNPRASDPSHSLLSKDHFALILNEPAGKVAQVVVIHTVQLLVKAWANDSDPNHVVDQILEAFHHPYYATGRSQIQQEMFETMQSWFNELDAQKQGETIRALTKESVREGKNKRFDEQGRSIQESEFRESSYGGGGGRKSQQAAFGVSQQGQGGRNEYDSSYGRSGADRESSDNYQSNERYGRGGTQSYGNEYGSYGAYGQRDDSGQYNDNAGYAPSYERSSAGYREEQYNTSGRDTGSYERNQEARYESSTYDTSTRRSTEDYTQSRERYESEGYSERQTRHHQHSQRDNEYGEDNYGRRQNEDRSGSGQDIYGNGQDSRYTEEYGSSENYEGRREGYSAEGYGDRGGYNSRDNNDNTYGGGRERDEGYDDGGREAYGGRGYDNDTYQGGLGSGRSEDSSGTYNTDNRESYESGTDDTYGAEKLSLNDGSGYRSQRGGYNEFERY